MNITNDRKRHIFKIAIVVFVLIIAFCLFMILRSWDNMKNQGGEYKLNNPIETISYKGKQYRLNKKVESILVMGVDKFDDEIGDEDCFINEQQADFLLLLVIDNANKEYKALHINRDTMTKIPALSFTGREIRRYTAQVALAHAYGSGKKDSCRNEVKAVSNLLCNVPITHYMSLTMDAVKEINDFVGGVTVTIEDEFADDSTLVKGETVTLMGDHALNYVRGRHSVVNDPTNLNRMDRQRNYMNILREDLISSYEDNPNFSYELIKKIAKYMVSDCTSSQLEKIADRMITYKYSDIRKIEGETKHGEEFLEFYPDEDSLTENVIDLFYTES